MAGISLNSSSQKYKLDFSQDLCDDSGYELIEKEFSNITLLKVSYASHKIVHG